MFQKQPNFTEAHFVIASSDGVRTQARIETQAGQKIAGLGQAWLRSQCDNQKQCLYTINAKHYSVDIYMRVQNFNCNIGPIL